MPLFLLPILSFLKSYWKPVAIIGGTLICVFLIYHKGVKDCEIKQEIAAQKDKDEREKQAAEEDKKIDETDHKIDVSIQKTPQDDKRDSCILSNDPYGPKRCI